MITELRSWLLLKVRKEAQQKCNNIKRENAFASEGCAADLSDLGVTRSHTHHTPHTTHIHIHEEYTGNSKWITFCCCWKNNCAVCVKSKHHTTIMSSARSYDQQFCCCLARKRSITRRMLAACHSSIFFHSWWCSSLLQRRTRVMKWKLQNMASKMGMVVERAAGNKRVLW